MQQIRSRLIAMHGDHPKIDIIVRDISDIVAKIEDAWERIDRQAFTTACQALRCYKPPEK